MSNVVRFPVIPRPVPAPSFTAGENPHENAVTAMRIWEDYALKNCGADWTAKVLEDRLWRARQRKAMEQK